MPNNLVSTALHKMGEPPEKQLSSKLRKVHIKERKQLFGATSFFNFMEFKYGHGYIWLMTPTSKNGF